MKFDLIMIGLLLTLAFGFSRCMDVSVLKDKVMKEEPFKVEFKEYKCSLTNKQLKINALNAEINKISR